MRLAILLAAGLFSATGAIAQTPSPDQGQQRHAAMAALQQACAADAARFCPGVQPGQGRLGQCFKGHRAELSDVCRSAIMNARQARAAAAATPH